MNLAPINGVRFNRTLVYSTVYIPNGSLTVVTSLSEVNPRHMTGLLTVTTGLAGAMTALIQIPVARVTLQLAPTGTLVRSVMLVGSTQVTLTAAGAMRSEKPLAGNLTTSMTVEGTLNMSGYMAGNISATTNLVGSIFKFATFGGVIAMTLDLSGDLAQNAADQDEGDRVFRRSYRLNEFRRTPQ